MNYLRLLVLIGVGVLSHLPKNGSASSWFNWSGWSACSSPLCSGTQERYRSCKNFLGRGKCVGPTKQSRKCVRADDALCFSSPSHLEYSWSLEPEPEADLSSNTLLADEHDSDISPRSTKESCKDGYTGPNCDECIKPYVELNGSDANKCRYGELQLGQTCYFYIHESSGYPDAHQRCQENKDGSHLVHMTSSCLYHPLLQYARVQHRAHNPEQRIYFFTWLGGTYETYSKSDVVDWSDGSISSIQSYWFPDNPQIIQYFPETTYLRLQISMDENNAFQGIFYWPLCQNCAYPLCQYRIGK